MVFAWSRKKAEAVGQGGVVAPTRLEPEASSAVDPSDFDYTLLGQWIGFADLQRHTMEVLRGEIERTSELVEDSTLDLSRRFRELAETAREQSHRVDEIVAMARFVEIDGAKVPLDELVTNMQEIIGEMIAEIRSINTGFFTPPPAATTSSTGGPNSAHCISPIATDRATNSVKVAIRLASYPP